MNRCFFVGTLICALGASIVAHAQERHVAEKIEITGSNIKRVESEGPAPLLILRREDLDQRAGQNLQDVLLALPFANVGSFAESRAAGTASISLRGLGSDSTLVLVNGRRLPVYGLQQNVGPPGIAFVNLNAIPTSAIERIEILKDGASAIYGSDAIAGVVNIILRKDFRGIELATSYGESGKGDTAETRASLTLGAGDVHRDRFNAMVTLDYYHRDPLPSSARERSVTADQRANGGSDSRQTQGSPGTWLTAGRGGFSTNTPFPDCPAESRENALSPSGVCAFNQNLYTVIFPRTQRKSAFGRASVVLAPALSAFLEASWNYNETILGGVPAPDSFTLPVGHNSNPYPFAVPILYRWSDVGQRFTNAQVETLRVVAGIEGSVRGFDWEAAFNRVSSDTYLANVNYLTIADRDALVAANRYSFVDPARNGPGYADDLRLGTWRTRYSEIQTYDAKASGTAYRLPAGPVRVAVGAEHRYERLDSARDPLWASGSIVSLPVDSREAGSRSVSAAFGEMLIPVHETVEVQLAVRHERYSDYGASTVPKFALAWKPAAPILVRAGYSEGFRAPSLVQLYLDQRLAVARVVDSTRCDGYGAAFGNSDPRTVVACARQEIRSLTGGNPQLDAEKSKGESLGILFEPMAGLSISADGYRIRHRGRIVPPGLDAIVANEDLFPGGVVRDPAGPDDLLAHTRGPIVGSPTDAQQRIGIYQYFFNAASQATRGVDLELTWRFDFAAAGKLALKSLNTYIDYLRTVAFPGQPATDVLGEDSAPRYRGTHSASWNRGAWKASMAVNVIGSSRQPTIVHGVRGNVASWTTVDTQASYSGFSRLTLTAGVRNVADRDPPFYDGILGFDEGTHSLVGRLFYARATWTFG